MVYWKIMKIDLTAKALLKEYSRLTPIFKNKFSSHFAELTSCYAAKAAILCSFSAIRCRISLVKYERKNLKDSLKESNKKKLALSLYEKEFAVFQIYPCYNIKQTEYLLKKALFHKVYFLKILEQHSRKGSKVFFFKNGYQIQVS